MSERSEDLLWRKGPSDLPPGEEPGAERTQLVGQEGHAQAGLPRIYVARDVMAAVESWARRPGLEASAGVLMGRALVNRAGQRFVLIDGAIEAPEVEAASRSVKFTPRAWKSLRAAAGSGFANREIIGWFHSRPDEPLYLSPYETFVHQTHFGAPWQVALVFDPASGQHAFWGWNGEVLDRAVGFRLWEAPASVTLSARDLERLGHYSQPVEQAAAAREGTPAAGPWERGTWPVSRAQALAASRRGRGAAAARPAWQQVTRAIQGITVLVLVFVGAMMARWGVEQVWPRFAGGPPQPAQEVIGGGPATPVVPQLPPKPGQAASPATPAAPAPSPPSGSAPPSAPEGSAAPALESYEVQPGDTLWAIAERFYGDPEAYRWLAQANGIGDPNLLRPGQRLVLPPQGDQRPRRK
ncbi:MAG: LysM domain-containing protein [Bacillota bacterium]